MFYTYSQKANKIEIVLSGDIDREGFMQVIHQLESLCAMYNDVEVIIDGSNVKKYQFDASLKELEFYRRYSKRLKKVCLVSDEGFHKFILDMFDAFSHTDFKTFTPDEIEKARKEVFPSRLPA